jgi:hypothetical protein
LEIINETNQVRIYKIEYLFQKMQENGSYIPVSYKEKAQLMQIQQYISFPAENIKLQPNKSKKITLKFNSQIPLQQREYFAHILFKQLPTEEISHQQLPENSDIAISAVPLFNIAIPVFVHYSHPKFAAQITEIHFEKKTGFVKFKIENQSEYSPYGEITISFFANNAITYQQKISGISIPKPLNTRAFHIQYPENLLKTSPPTRLEIKYKSYFVNDVPYVIGQNSIKISK